jgi:hypothetical protein
MLLKKCLVLAIDLIICKETGPKINIGGGSGYPFFSGQLSVVSDQKSPAHLVIVHWMIVRRGKVIICNHLIGLGMKIFLPKKGKKR